MSAWNFRSMDNPFNINYPDYKDNDLIGAARNGDKNALHQLIIRHQIFVYNLALKMSRNAQDAEDLTQEVFIKLITSLSTFEGKSKFRTWLYRITVNHFLNTRKRKTEIEISDFDSYFSAIGQVPTYELNEAEADELKESIEEIRISCTAGMLMCLDREQRLIYILGEMFRIDHQLASEILDISPGNFRIRLMRARDDLHSWMNKKCGLINSNNPCRCSKKTKGYIEKGVVNPDNLQFNVRYRQKMYGLSKREAAHLTEEIEDLQAKIFLDHPLQDPFVPSKLIAEILSNDLIKSILDK